VTLAAARDNRFGWNADAAYRPSRTEQAGPARAARQVDLATLAEFIDWGPFFQTWDLAGSYPKILDDAAGRRDGARRLRRRAEDAAE
jgi:5-methyltetrahydrofolate--homocysteine methyltransferase